VKTLGTSKHSREQGQRVHHLANLGGLVVLAGLERERPDFLLGALISLARESGGLTAAQRAQVASAGKKVLDERAASKRAWKSWTRSQELHSVTLSSSQIREIIAALGGDPPEDCNQLPFILSELLSEACDGSA